MEQVGKDSWSAVEIGPRRLLPALPEWDEELGKIRWGRWERHLVVTHIDPSCGTCGYGGPLATVRGMTLYQDPPRRKLVQRSAIARGQRAVGGPVVVTPPRWVYTHTASRCQACDEMLVWLASGQGPRCSKCAAPSPAALLGKRRQCPACLVEAEHLVPRWGRVGTWVEVAYNPPRVEEVPPGPAPGAGQETLF